MRKAEQAGDVDFLREGVRVLSQALMEVELSRRLGAERYERTAERVGQRNGYRERDRDTRVGTIGLRVPRVREGGYVPGWLEPRKRAEQAPVAVVREAYVQGVSTRKVDGLVKALGLDGISKSQVSRLRAALDEEVERFRNRRLEGDYPYLWLDATFVKVRDGGRAVGMAVVIAIGVNGEGQREVLGLDVGPSEDGACWHAFLRGLVARGLAGVQPVCSDAHQGLKGAVAAVLQRATWRRCRVHFLRNLLALVPKSAREMVAATVRTVFARPDPAMAREQWRKVADGLRERFPRAAALPDGAGEDVLAYLAFPREHWRQIWSNDPLERLNKEVKRRTDVVGISPTQPAVIGLVGAVLAEQHDEWQACRRYFSAESLAKLRGEVPTEPPALLAAS